jgi:hypothetical protein
VRDRQRNADGPGAKRLLYNWIANTAKHCGLAALVLLLWGHISSDAIAQQPLPSAPSATGVITGTVTDPSGALVTNAAITLTRDDATEPVSTESVQHTTTDPVGHYAFTHVPAGNYKISAQAAQLAPASLSITLTPGQIAPLPAIILAVSASAEVSVTLTQAELSEEYVRAAERQRAFGFIPNFLVSYHPDAPPLTTKQKFSLGLHETLDPGTFIMEGAVAGFEQGLNIFHGYGQGAAGYGKRFGAITADTASDTLLRDSVYASLFHEDPRYFYRGTGSFGSRLWYSISTAAVGKNDRGQWGPAYASIAGNFSSSALSNAYYPHGSSRDGVAGTLQDGVLRLAGVALAHIVQEFLIKPSPGDPATVRSTP